MINALTECLKHMISGNKKEWRDFLSSCLLSSRSYVRVVPGSPTTFHFALATHLFTFFTRFTPISQSTGGNLGETVPRRSAGMFLKLESILPKKNTKQNYFSSLMASGELHALVQTFFGQP